LLPSFPSSSPGDPFPSSLVFLRHKHMQPIRTKRSDAPLALPATIAINLSSSLPFDLGSVVGTTDGFRVGLGRWETSLLLVFGKKVADDHM